MKTVIIVDDDPGILETMEIILQGMELGVTTFQNGDVILNNNFIPPDIFVIDKQLSGMNGLDICRYLKNREATKNIPVIMISASPDIQKLAKEAMADASIEKPFNIKDLRDLVTHHLYK